MHSSSSSSSSSSGRSSRGYAQSASKCWNKDTLCKVLLPYSVGGVQYKNFPGRSSATQQISCSSLHITALSLVLTDLLPAVQSRLHVLAKVNPYNCTFKIFQLPAELAAFKIF
jgi:hypothetical protein